jgi:hypothetical protein
MQFSHKNPDNPGEFSRFAHWLLRAIFIQFFFIFRLLMPENPLH